MQKPKFKPEITRVKLNPEQAVLTCTCYSRGRASYGFTPNRNRSICFYGTKKTGYCNHSSPSSAQS